MDTHVLANPKLATILGGLVADAASLGLHWLYDPNQIAEIEKESDIAFRQPNENDYANVSGFFAHGSKVAGDSSGYGEICLLMLKHLAKHGQFNHMAYQLEFRAFFGPGGEYTGYVDSPTRQTIRTLLPLDAKSFPATSGADDDQMPTLATVPVLVATHQGTVDSLMKQVEEVVRITNHNDIAVSAAQCAAALLNGILMGKPLNQAATDALPLAEDNLRLLLEQALSLEALDSVAAANRFGSACHVTEGLPIVFHIAKHTHDYRTAINANIRAGGDSCGRSIILGALVAAHLAAQNRTNTGIPLPWLARYRKLTMAADACQAIMDVPTPKAS